MDRPHFIASDPAKESGVRAVVYKTDNLCRGYHDIRFARCTAKLNRAYSFGFWRIKHKAQ